ncbi:S8 family peptidase [Streptomyces antimycoticus]|uniref:Serine protease n=1 Tax=Streptomyces mordarskii TaxID=1226758 RepID=A0ABP3NCM5_9ACTN|nr:S8 family peptidase [Streptomyces sp. WAC05858]RSS40971.1 S8 family peptidase [Streptomyces sp. WAC05858]WTA84160.1 S8 family peptidase [Streptomyces antimycoticus]WTB05405.1 S8 family peptidase [Streptomyces antimycoticus]
MACASAGPRRRVAAPAAVVAVVLVVLSPAQTVPAQGVQATGGAGAHGQIAADHGYIVALKRGTGAPPAASGAGRALVERYGARVRRVYGSALNGYAVRANAAQAGRLAADPRIASVTRDERVSLRWTRLRLPVPPRRQARPPWGLDRIDQPDRPLDGAYTAPGGGGRGTTIYVIDSGVRASHEDFGGRARSGWDFVDDDPVAEDGNGHGTHVAATAAGTRYGVAKKAAIVAVRVLDDRGEGTIAQVLAGMDWVLRHARRPAVVNLSLGSAAATPLPEWDAAVRTGIAAGLVFTVAAGNQDRPAASFSPGRVPGALTVGSTDRADRRSGFSNWGPGIDLFAPGDRIVSASNAGDTATRTLSGTSMAAPHVAGAAALYLAGHRFATPAQVGAALIAGASRGRVRDAGAGSPNRLPRVAN